jgi:UV DNA damage endonuclease
MPPKRKRSSIAALASVPPVPQETSILPPGSSLKPSAPKRQSSRRSKIETNPDHNLDIVDGKAALRASPDADEEGDALAVEKVNTGPTKPPKTNGVESTLKNEDSDSPLSDIESETSIPQLVKKQKKTPTKSSIAAKKGSDEIKAFKTEQAAEAKVKTGNDGDEWDKRVDPDLPWKGRLGYVSISLMISPRNRKLTFGGLSEHLPSIFKSTSVHISHLSNRINP